MSKKNGMLTISQIGKVFGSTEIQAVQQSNIEVFTYSENPDKGLTRVSQTSLVEAFNACEEYRLFSLKDTTGQMFTFEKITPTSAKLISIVK